MKESWYDMIHSIVTAVHAQHNTLVDPIRDALARSSLKKLETSPIPLRGFSFSFFKLGSVGDINFLRLPTNPHTISTSSQYF